MFFNLLVSWASVLVCPLNVTNGKLIAIYQAEMGLCHNARAMYSHAIAANLLK